MRLAETVRHKIKTEYVETDISDTDLEYGAIRGMLAALKDPYSRFMEPKNFSEMKVRMQGQFFGIGIHIGMREHQLTVISPISGTPAARAGLKALDKIKTIDGKSTSGMGLQDAVSVIRGERGTTVMLGIQSDGSEDVRDVPIIRDAIKIKAVDKTERFQDKFGYVRLNTFESTSAAREMYIAIQRLMQDGIQGLVIDLRNNGGGLLENAVRIASLFMQEGDVVHTIDRNGNKTTRRVFGRPLYPYAPLVVLINQGSASASEILAGAIRDNKRGTLVGTKTFGKASVQKIINLKDGSAVLLTMAKYYTPQGTDINKTGITPDIESVIPTAAIKEASKTGYVYSYDKDPQLQKALEILGSQL